LKRKPGKGASSQPSGPALRYDAVVFDVGGTLIGFHDRAPFHEFLNHVCQPASDDNAHLLHQSFLSVLSASRDSAQGLGADEEEFRVWWYGNLSRIWPDRSDMAEEMLRWLWAGRFDRPFADTLPALQALKNLGLPVGVLSNFGTHLRAVLRRLDLCEHFDFVIVSAEVGLAKPDPHIFDLAVSRVGQPRHRILYVGDHVGGDIEGAQSAGLDAVLIDRNARVPVPLCPRIDSLLDLLGYVRPALRPSPAIIFDMDGVVLDSMPMHLITWQQTLAPLGIELAASDLYPLEGIPTETTAQRLTERFLGQSCSIQEARCLAGAKRSLFRQLFEPTLVPGIAPLLHDLRGRGYRLALVTGSAQSVLNESLVPTGVAHLFETAVTGDQVSKGKPHPEPYRLAAARLGLLPSECLVVENGLLGIASAKAAGMACVALETTLNSDQLSSAAPDRVFPNAEALRTWLLSLWRRS
jgi:HAD superfamily hydrolase (TIGR01549 family)/HAD superfamily hydrolase (TIGR01509 family)